MATLAAEPNKPRPTRVRYLVIGVATLMAVVLYLHRLFLGFLERYIKEDLGLSDDQISVVLGAFFLAYGLGQVPGGWLADRWGVRRALTLYIFAWSLFTALMGVVAGFLVVLALRLGFGLAQAGAYPAAANLVGRWVPAARRGLASSVVALGGRVGGAAAPVLTAYLLVAFVPREAPTSLAPQDLFDAPKLCRQLTAADDSAAARLGRRAVSAMPEAESAVRALAALGPDEAPSAGEVAALTAGLNGLLAGPELCRNDSARELPLPAEARAMMQRPPEELTAADVRRLNRLILETAYPEHVKKLYCAGWRPVMAVYGAIGLAVAALFWLCVRDDPASHPLCNAAEVALIEPGPRVPRPSQPGPLPLGPLLRSRSMWLMSLNQFSGNIGWLFLIAWLPRYLDAVHKVPVLERGVMAGVPLLVGMIGMLAGGWLTDRLTRAVGLRWGRCLPILLSRAVAVCAFASCLLFDTPWPVVLALALVAVATDLGVPAIWAYNQDVGGRYVGAVLGWNNMWGNFGAAIAPWVLKQVFVHVSWDAMFLFCAATFLVSGLMALGVDARVPIEKPQAAE
jgi:sugar phosphate permease